MTEPLNKARNPESPMVPSDLAMIFSISPTLSSSAYGYEDIVLQRFQRLPDIIDLPGMRHEVLVCHLAGPFLAEASSGSSRVQRQWINPGYVGVNPSGIPVHRVLKGKADVVLLHFPATKLRKLAEEAFEVDPSRVALIPKLGESDKKADQLMRWMLHEAESSMPSGPLMGETLCRALMIHVLRRHSNLAPLRVDTPVSISPGQVRNVVEYMRTHMDRNLSICELAQVGGLSPARFSRAFHRSTGQPPHRFLVELRIKHARQLLEKTDLPITEVGLRCGFEQPSHFAGTFRRVVGISPRAWRLENRV